MNPALCRLNLTTHILASLGWVGAVISFLALSIAGLCSRDVETVRGAYVAMNLVGQWVLVPLSLVALLTGVVQSLGTRWGLFRYYWVLAKFILTIIATTALLLHQFTAVASAARQVSDTSPGLMPDVGTLGAQLVADAGIGLLLLVVITILAVYKPWGRTSFGNRPVADPQLPIAPASAAVPLGLKIFLAVLALLAAMFLIVHLAGGGFHHHGH